MHLFINITEDIEELRAVRREAKYNMQILLHASYELLKYILARLRNFLLNAIDTAGLIDLVKVLICEDSSDISR